MVNKNSVCQGCYFKREPLFSTFGVYFISRLVLLHTYGTDFLLYRGVLYNIVVCDNTTGFMVWFCCKYNFFYVLISCKSTNTCLFCELVAVGAASGRLPMTYGGLSQDNGKSVLPREEEGTLIHKNVEVFLIVYLNMFLTRVYLLIMCFAYGLFVYVKSRSAFVCSGVGSE